MTVEELIENLKVLPQDALVVKGGFDHSYNRIYGATDAKADCLKGQMSEFDENYGEPFGVIIDVVVIE